MTYCLALKLRDGLVFASDSRTTAGVDYISTYRKMHVFQPSGDRLLVVLTSGNLATTQEVLDNLRRDLATARADREPGDAWRTCSRRRATSARCFAPLCSITRPCAAAAAPTYAPR